MCDTLNAPWLLTNRQFQWTDNGHSQLPLAELGKLSPNIDLLHTTGLFDLDLWPTTLTHNHRLAKVKFDPHAKIKVKGQTVQTGQTDGHTHTHTYITDATKRIISPCYAVDRPIISYHRHFTRRW